MLVFVLTGVAHAGEYGHYSPFLMGLRDYLVPAVPGFYYVQYNFYYTSDDFRDADGNSVNHFTIDTSRSDTQSTQRTISTPGGNVEVKASITGTARLRADVDLDVQCDSRGIVPAFIYVSDWKILGARYAAYVAVPAVYNRLKVDLRSNLQLDLGLTGTVTLTGPGGQTIERSGGVASSYSRQYSTAVDESQTSLGDIFVQPVWLGWNGKHFAASLAYGLYTPTGKYDVGALDNTGLGYWTHQFQASGAWYPWEHQATALHLIATYELHSNKEDVDVRPGSRLTLNYGISQFLPLKKDQTILAELALKGYNQWQVSDDSGSDARVPDVHDRVFGYGVQLGTVFVKYNATVALRWMHEYGARDHFQGDYWGLNFAVKF